MSAPSACGLPLQPALGEAQAIQLAPVTNKASAILGGQVSQLELIARQQGGFETARAALGSAAPGHSALASTLLAPTTSLETTTLGTTTLGTAALGQTAQLPGAGLAPAAGGRACLNFAMPRIAALEIQPGYQQAPLDSEDFLASKRLAVRRTTFDTAWHRVQHDGLPRHLARGLSRSTLGKVNFATLSAVNAWTNTRVRYVDDKVLYGKSDYWASAQVTLRRRAGDCEDIAIAKMQLLAAMGIARSDMYLTIARDLARNADHAVLIVKLENRHWLLDNATNAVLDASTSYDYRPIMSFSTSQKWLHGYGSGG